MSTDTPEIAAARIEAERARVKMMATARQLQGELLGLLSPQNLARDIWEGAKEKGADLAEEAVDAVRRRPAIASGVVAALALFFAREPLIDMAGKLAGGVKAKRKSRPAKTVVKAGQANGPARPRTRKRPTKQTATKQKATETIS